MNKLQPEHLHLLLDEPIYVLRDDHVEELDKKIDSETAKKTPKVAFEGENKKGVLIFIGEKDQDNAEDKIFLFKGLNALNISAEDVAIVEGSINPEATATIKHTKRLCFSDDTPEDKLYRLTTSEGVVSLDCHSISQICNSQDLKRKFWEALQALFKQ